MKKLSGKLIVIEGACDGIGKTTQYKLLKKYLIENGYEVYTHHFPSYNTYYGELATKYLSGDLGDPNCINPYLIHELFAVDRAITYEKEIKKALEEGKVILLDRYTTSSQIYQSSVIDDEKKKNEFIEFIEDYEYKKLGLTKPDNVIFLYASYEMAKKLRKNRIQNDGVENDIHEINDDYLKKVYDNAVYVSKKCNFDTVNSEENGRIKSKENIHNQVKKIILK